jgi:outer membrane lipoprotein LolB
MRALPALALLMILSGCFTTRAPAPLAPSPWDSRLTDLQQAASWQLNGRVAVALGTQGWQATLDWRERGGAAELHLAGPLGVGAQVIAQTPSGLSINGAPPSDGALAQLQDKLGFDLPIEDLRYWLLGIPSPRAQFDLTRNAQDRAQHLAQSGWSIDYDRYLPVSGDVLPTRIVLTRDQVRVRIVADRWALR